MPDLLLQGICRCWGLSLFRRSPRNETFWRHDETRISCDDIIRKDDRFVLASLKIAAKGRERSAAYRGKTEVLGQ